MSRSSKGFADFFPTAPAVLKAQKKGKSPLNGSSRVARTSSVRADRSPKNTDISPIADRPPHTDLGIAAGQLNAQEEPEAARTDLAHEVGSASSTSTVSSMFSNRQKSGATTNVHYSHNLANLTPLTTLDSSPRTNGVLSPAKRPVLDGGFPPEMTSPSPFEQSLEKGYSPTDSESACTPQPSRDRARPSKGEDKGFRIIYDPVTDKSGKAKDKRSRSPHYEAFGRDVGELIP